MNNNIRAIFHSAILQMKLSMARPMFQFVVWLSPLFYATITFLVYGSANPTRLFQYVVLGSGFMGLWTSIVYSSASDINRERMYGTLENIFVAPVSFAYILIGKILGNTLWGIFSMVLSFVYLTIVFAVEMPLLHIGLLLTSIITVIICISVFAFVLALLMTLTKYAQEIMNVMEYPIFLLCGFMFPVSILPIAFQWIAYILPPTWAIQLLRAVTTDSTVREIWQAFLGLVGLTIICGIIGYCCYQMVERKARIQGKLGVY